MTLAALVKARFVNYGFIKSRLNHWNYMEYFNDVFTTFLGLVSGSCVSVNGGIESSRFHLKD